MANKATLQPDTRGFQIEAVRGLLKSGWKIDQVPKNGLLSRNGQLVMLRATGEELKVRLWIFKVTSSSRGRPSERRVEITTTYKTGLRRARGYRDIVLGYEVSQRVFVGLDPRRMNFGGATGNASSFLDAEGFAQAKASSFHLRYRANSLFPAKVEYQAFFLPSFLAEYLFNTDSIHQGSYDRSGLFSAVTLVPSAAVTPALRAPEGSTKRILLVAPRQRKRTLRTIENLVQSYEKGRRLRRTVSPEERRRIQERCEQNGGLAEDFVLKKEQSRLRRARRPELAARIRRVSEISDSAGYDIHSFEKNGTPRYIEVKGAQGDSTRFDMSLGEWGEAGRRGVQYYIYRVNDVRGSPRLTILRNPHDLVAKGTLTKDPSGWLIYS